MAHFAQLDENDIVITVLVVDNEKLLNNFNVEDENLGILYLKNIFSESSNWVQTSYNNNFRVRMAAPNYKYDRVLDAFIPPKPYDSWIFDDVSKSWISPIPHPNDGNSYMWDENNQTWIEG